MTSSYHSLERSRTRPESPTPRTGSIQPPIRVIIADDHALLREGLKLLLNLHGGIVVVDEVDRVSGLTDLLMRTSCDVVLLGFGVGTESLSELEALSRLAKILLVCGGEQSEDVIVAMRAGAHGAIFKRGTIDLLIEAIGAVHAGQIWMPPEIQSRMVASFHAEPSRRLTRREHEVVRHVALGRRNAEVAKMLFITEQTVKTHLGHIFRKTGSRDRVELALYAARLGIISLSERRL
ncbi:MAG: response regulator transcription factor [Candidatus Binatia bacterium]